MEKAQMRIYSIKSESSGYQLTTKSENNFSVKTDLSQKAGGKGDGASSIELFLASLAGCENFTAQIIAKNLGFTIFQSSFDIKGERNDRGLNHTPITEESPYTSRLSRIWGIVNIDTDETDEQIYQLNNILKKICPLARMVIDSGCELEIEWKRLD
ncbi:hypothetical protein ABPG72_010773 [Tetrahymena utriculariae]